MGPDKVHLLVLRQPAEEVAKPLPIVFEKSCPSTEAPTDWKMREATPTFKNRNKEDTGNYSSFSLTSDQKDHGNKSSWKLCKDTSKMRR